MLIQHKPFRYFHAVKKTLHLLERQEIEVWKILIQKINQTLALLFIIVEHSEMLGNT